MIRAIATVAAAVGLATAPTAGVGAAPRPASAVQRHHYTIAARIRPLLLFWITRADIGDAIVTERREINSTEYSLLIGSDPERAPRRINRWGFIDERVHAGGATLTGLMTESDEESIHEAERNLAKHDGVRIFKVIRAGISGDQARSVVTSIAAPSDYSFRQADMVLDLAQRQPVDGRTRVIQLPAGTRPGLLTALAEAIHSHVDQWQTTGRVEPGTPLAFVYHGKIYQLATTRADVQSGARAADGVAHVIAAQFAIKNTRDGEVTPFALTYAADGPLVETPLSASFQPRWWLQIDLALTGE